MLKKLALGVVAAVGLLALVVATRPAHFRVERSTVVDVPASAVFPLVNDLRAWPRWSPWERRDPAMKRTYSGPPAGEGATYEWNGNGDVGEGRMTITESVPHQLVAIRLEFLRPMQATNQVRFAFQGDGDDTRVIWSMEGTNGFVGKAISLFLDMDTMVGADFETGLANMKAAAEAGTSQPNQS